MISIKTYINNSGRLNKETMDRWRRDEIMYRPRWGKKKIFPARDIREPSGRDQLLRSISASRRPGDPNSGIGKSAMRKRKRCRIRPAKVRNGSRPREVSVTGGPDPRVRRSIGVCRVPPLLKSGPNGRGLLNGGVSRWG